VLATGPSMSQEIADYVRGKCRVVAVNDAFRLAPWADALVGNDRAWWCLYPEALNFAGRKFAGTSVQHVERLAPNEAFPPGTNSGLQGMRVARHLGAKRILLCGFDMHGDHYFGKHPEPLKNTTPERLTQLIAQFDRWVGSDVINCTPGSKLTRFRFMDLREALPDVG
jgi:hypothetical protein